jgi:hypothetical protein
MLNPARAHKSSRPFSFVSVSFFFFGASLVASLVAAAFPTIFQLPNFAGAYYTRP